MPCPLSLSWHDTTRSNAQGVLSLGEIRGGKESTDWLGTRGGLLATTAGGAEISSIEESILSAIDHAVAAGAREIIAVPLLLQEAWHTKNDIPNALHEARARHS